MTTVPVVRLDAPVVDGQVATFSWSVEPRSELYRACRFELRFPDAVDLTRVPQAAWWRIALACLHPHWVLLRPCRVVLPVALAPGEREVWMRLCDAAVASLEARVDGTDTGRSIELVEAGPPLAPLEAPSGDAGVVSCFSGGRDSLTQMALLTELGERPTLVTVTAPRPGSVDHATERRRHVMAEAQRRTGLELVDVRSDLRGCWRNEWMVERYGMGLSEVTDTFLYASAALAVAFARGSRAVLLASEAEVQQNARRGGAIVQARHFMYSAATQRVIDAILAPAGIHHGGLTYPLLQFQLQRLLARRYGELRDLQYSCWEMSPSEPACSRCSECRGIAFNLMAEGVSPAEIGIDVATLLTAQAGWRPTDPATLPGTSGRPDVEGQLLRCIARLPPDRVRPFVDGNGTAASALEAYGALREQVLDRDVPPEPGFRAGYLALVGEDFRAGVEAIYAEHFEREDPAAYAEHLRRTVVLSDWITAPLRSPGLDPRRRPGPEAPAARPVAARAPSPPPLTDAELAPIRSLIPDPEPELGRAPDGSVLRVTETLLDGNERAYVDACVEQNWVSSTGAFVGRFEEAFAEVTGTSHAVACSSGTTALHLALAASGVGPGDEVIVPAFTMVACANAVGYVGATPVFVDTDPRTWNLDVDRVLDAIGERTRAIMAVHTYGQPADMDAIRRIAEANGLAVVEDAAEAHGATLDGRPVGGLGTVGTFSFYGNKIITTGEGGMVTTNDPEVGAVARELRDHGFSPERHFWHRFRAFNFRMSNLQAAIGLAQVERLDDLLEARRRHARLYREALHGVPGLETPPEIPGRESAHWMFGVCLGREFGMSRDELRRHLAADGIETRTFFVPLHIQPSYLRENACRRFPVAERLGATGLYLPSSPSLGEAGVERVAASIRRAAAAGG